MVVPTLAVDRKQTAKWTAVILSTIPFLTKLTRDISEHSIKTVCRLHCYANKMVAEQQARKDLLLTGKRSLAFLRA